MSKILDNVAQMSLKRKAAQLDGNRPVSTIKKVVEHDNGATVYYTTGSPSVRNIPLQYWLGEVFED